MSLTKYPNGVSSYGLPVIGGQFITTGTVFFVDSNTGSNSYDGRDKDHPFSSITGALGKCTANRGDVVYAMPGHVETISSSETINFNIAGVTVIGIGHGYLRPRLEFGSTASASVIISSCDVTIENFVFSAYSAAVDITGPVRVDADDFTLLNCEMILPSSESLVHGIYMAGTSSHRMTIDNLKVAGGATTANDVTVDLIHVGGGGEHKIINSFIAVPNIGSSLAAGIVNMSSAATTSQNGCLIANDIIVTSGSTAGVCCINITTASGAGVITDCYLGHGDDGEKTHIGGTSGESEYSIFKTYIANVLGEVGTPYPVAASAT